MGLLLLQFKGQIFKIDKRPFLGKTSPIVFGKKSVFSVSPRTYEKFWVLMSLYMLFFIEKFPEVLRTLKKTNFQPGFTDDHDEDHLRF